jgi:hypothetical protein
MKNFTPLLISGAAYFIAVQAQGSPSKSGYHYTPDWSSWAPVTVYATVTESTTIYTPVPTTIYVTISSTTTTSTTATATVTTSTTTTTEKDVTIIESFTTTTPVTTTKPVTATEIIKEVVTSTTEQITITLCTSRDTNPTYTAAILPLPSDYTWGCPPGYLCKPKQENCNFEVGLPSESYYCAPDECIPAAPLPPPQLWNPDIYGNASPANDPNLKWNVVGSYFNMNPADYGLSYEIFVETQVITHTYTETTIEAPTPVVRARQAQTSVPAACYPWCNNCLLEAQAVGKTPALCANGSAFEVDVNDCEQCIAYHKSDTSGTFVKIAPQFQQFINYCAQISAPATVSTPTSTFTSKPVPVVQTSSSKTPPHTLPSSSTVTATLTVAGPTTATVGGQSTHITPTTVTLTTPSIWTTTLTFTLSGPTNISISAYTPDTTHYSTSTLTSTMTLTGPTTITYSGSALPSSAISSKATVPGSSTSSAAAPPATFSGSAAPVIRPNGMWTSIFSVLGSMLACVFWI